MKKFISAALILALLLISGAVSAVEPSLDQQIQEELKAYFDLRYKMLSSLTYDPSITNHLSQDILYFKEALNEADVLETIINYRKAQINDLRFDRFNYDLVYDNPQEKDNTISVAVKEHYSLYFNCAPTVKNEASVEHIILLKKSGTRWLIVKDDYSDPEGIKKMLTSAFINDGLSVEEAKKKIISQTDYQIAGRVQKLEKLIKEAGEENLLVLFTGKPIAYVAGYSGKIDTAGDVTPIKKDNMLFLPIRFVAEKLGAVVEWDAKENVIKINGEVVGVNGAFQRVNGRILLPVSIVADLFDKKVYEDESGLVILCNKSSTIEKNSAFITKLKEYGSILFTKVDFPRIDGSTATYPLSMEIGKELLGLDDTGVKGFITHQTTHNAYVNLINGDADIIFVTQPSADELSLAAQKGIDLDVIPLCKEGFVFLVNQENPVKSVTAQQIRDIYQGKITNWNEVGGENQPIIPYQREANSGSQTIMENTVMKGLSLMTPPKEVIVYGMGELIDRVADYSNARNALGYSVYYYATHMYQARAVKLLAINGVMPEEATIGDGTYPFTVEYYAVLRKDEPEKSGAHRLLKWILGDEGQAIVERAGLVSID